jgi:TRAP-type transport system small permease protein
MRGEHVVFDTLDSYLPAWALKLQLAVVNFLCAAALLGLAWVMWGNGNQFMASGETTAQLKLLKAPFIYGMAMLCAVTGLVHFGMVLKPPADESEAAAGTGVAL